MDHPARMGAIKVQHSGERLRGPLYLAETEVAQRLHQMAMNTVASLEIVVEDEGPGIAVEARRHLFVPYFTTKPGGSGIGLVLCRQIAEGHDGSVSLEPGPGGRGSRATLSLPL